MVTTTELVGWEHSMKNELIIAVKPKTPNAKKIEEAKIKLQSFTSALNLPESIYS